MEFENQPESSNIEDRRASGSPRRIGGSPFGGGMRLPMGRGGLSLGGLLLLLAITYFMNGGDLGGLLGGRSDGGTAVHAMPEEEALKAFVGQVLATTETCWRDVFRERLERSYEEPTLVLFRDGVRSACGVAATSVGPFYCPGDSKLYIDLSFLSEMGRTLGASGDFAQAYVIAHEVGHHVQNLLGTSQKVQALHGSVGSEQYNHASVQLELQADYFAGVWAHYVQHRMQRTARLEVGDYEEAIRAALAVGDDTLQRRATGHVMPEKFTHGTAAQRAKWFRLGFETGDPLARDPFQEEK